MTRTAIERSVLARVGRSAGNAPRRYLLLAILVTVAAGVFGIPVAKSLCACGFEDPAAESARAAALLTDEFGQGESQLLIIVSAPEGYRSDPARQAGEEITEALARSPYVATVVSAWSATPQVAPELVSRDDRSGLIVAGLTGPESEMQQRARELADQLVHDRGGVTVRAGGSAMVDVQITEQSQRDLLLMESLAIPLSFVVLVWVFGGLLAAAIPVAVGAMAILGALAVLRAVTLVTDVSIFALNLSAALGLALAIDYTLLLISRFRDEVAEGARQEDAVITMMMTAGRTVVFSATIVALSMAVMVLFPMHFLKSFAYAGVATVGLAALAALVVTPAAIMLFGNRLSHSRFRTIRSTPPVQQQALYRWTTMVMRRATPFALAVVVLLLLLGAPFAGVNWGFPDDRVLPAEASARQVGDQLRDEFVNTSATAVTVVIPDVKGLTQADIEGYRARLYEVPDVAAVSSPTIAGDSGFLTVSSTAPLFSESSEAQLNRLHETAGPAGREILLTGTAQTNRDSVAAITSRLPVVLGLIAAIMFVLLFLLTGSVAIPLKALVLNVLSLTAAFGAMVWIFQDGHLGGLGTTPTGTLVANIPVLLFCIAFGLSMDYEVFLVSRIREFWLASRMTTQKKEANNTSVALGIARTGRVVTAAALVMSISFAALIASDVSFMRMFGLGLTLAVLADATLVRLILMPAFMHLLGEWNWWAPAWMTRIHHRIGLRDGELPRAPAHLADSSACDVTPVDVLNK
ncbi:Trehalose monomycolate exporter MmpL3 [Mycolicibacterium vanbaalenii]|uniref:Trehalose monomycolate exporter MmpL3 n=1 Tax=Mycolicibacterium vanbaalenii TaxID=110539 RepID=A0A5S9QHC9_MYCVN|nr:Trehalose monomycolate exporter MmpL3 [Mycolicibacterium vanbaalenii]